MRRNLEENPLSRADPEVPEHVPYPDSCWCDIQFSRRTAFRGLSVRRAAAFAGMISQVGPLPHGTERGRLSGGRDRRVFALLLCITIALGLASRRYPFAIPRFLALYAGDTLWASMVFFLLALVLPRQRSGSLAAVALMLAFLVECSQLYHPRWLDVLRGTRLGALALGSDFLWSDLVCYTLGVALALAVDRALPRPSDVAAPDR